MGETPRKQPNHVNGWARSSDVRTILRNCGAEWLWSLLAHKEQKRDNINFDLGTAFHTIPEEVLSGGMDIDSAINHSIHVLDELLARHTGDNPITGKRSKNPNILSRNLFRMGRQWYQDVIVEAPFGDADVAVEYDVVIEGQLRTQLDAMFSRPGLFDIVDWKSGTSTKADDMQLWIYEYGLRRNGTISDDDTATGWFYFPWHGEWKQAAPYPGNLVVAAWLDETLIRKKSMMDTAGTPVPDWYCDYCAVQESLCPIFNDGSWEKVDALWEERQPVLVNMEGTEIG